MPQTPREKFPELAVDCETCKAEPDEFCHITNPYFEGYPHASRYTKYMEQRDKEAS